MPSIYTHKCFALDVKKKLPKNIKNIIDGKEDFYLMFSQSFDNLYYYNFLTLKKGKHIRNLGTHCHTHRVNKYFKNIISYIKDNKLNNDNEILCYLFGAINHYISDSTLHPYITYRTGKYSKHRKKETTKYKGVHTNVEIQIDAFYYNKNTNNKFKKYKIYQDIPKLKFSNNLKKTIEYTFKETFNVENMGEIFNKSYNQSYLIYRILMYDPYGIKTDIYKFIDRIIPNKDRVLASFSLHKEPINERFFNKKHNYWCHPLDMDIISDCSWDDLYKKALKKASELIKDAYKCLNDDISIDKLLKALENNSYSSGLDIHDKRVAKYFEF